MPTSLQIPSKVYIPGDGIKKNIHRTRSIHCMDNISKNNLQIHQTFIRIQLTCTQF